MHQIELRAGHAGHAGSTLNGVPGGGGKIGGGDELMTERGTRVLLDCYANAPRRIERIAPADVQAKRIGHFGFFREQFQSTLWQRTAQLLHGFHTPQETHA